jgi:hypothetical protein
VADAAIQVRLPETSVSHSEGRPDQASECMQVLLRNSSMPFQHYQVTLVVNYQYSCCAVPGASAAHAMPVLPAAGEEVSPKHLMSTIGANKLRSAWMLNHTCTVNREKSIIIDTMDINLQCKKGYKIGLASQMTLCLTNQPTSTLLKTSCIDTVTQNWTNQLQHNSQQEL